MSRGAPSAPVPDARAFAIETIHAVIRKRQALDALLDRLAGDGGFAALSPPDRGLTRAIATSALRGLGIIRAALSARMAGGMPADAGPLEPALIAGVAQLLFLNVPDHAAVHATVERIKADRHGRRYAPLANAVLRAIARDKAAILAGADPLADNTPGWLAERWTRTYGEETARAIACAHLDEPPLDLTVKTDAAGWADRLGGVLLPTGSVRLRNAGSITALPGFEDGAWWVQDMAAALPARILAPKPGERVLDLCAAPGGKTAQLVAAGAQVVAVDRSAPRLRRLTANLDRLGLTAEVQAADGLTFSADPFDAVLLDAPCSATGTLRRHPDTAWNRTLADLASLVDLQARLLDSAWRLTGRGGRLVYATCSLEPEEGERQVAAFLARTPDAALIPINAAMIGNCAELIDPAGFLRVLPSQFASLGGCDGFFAALIVKSRP